MLLNMHRRRNIPPTSCCVLCAGPIGRWKLHLGLICTRNHGGSHHRTGHQTRSNNQNSSQSVSVFISFLLTAIYSHRVTTFCSPGDVRRQLKHSPAFVSSGQHLNIHDDSDEVSRDFVNITPLSIVLMTGAWEQEDAVTRCFHFAHVSRVSTARGGCGSL